METNWYNLSRKWFDFCFDNPDKINTNHTALFMFIIEQWNRFWQKEKFWLPALYSMEALWIKSKTTYYKAFNDLVDFWFIEIIEMSKNQNTANIIAISKNKSAHKSAHKSALDLANVQQVDSTCVSGGNINKQINNKQLNNKKNKQIISKEITKQEFWNEEINKMQDFIKEKVKSFWLIYKKWKYERERIKNILTWKDFWEICENANMTRKDFVWNIILISTKLDFWNGKIYNAETFYKYYAQIYNEAKRIKTEEEKNKPKILVV